MHGVRQWREFLDRAADLVVSYGGSLSGEHGDGQARAALLTKMYGDELVGAFADFKDFWDPDGKMNPARLYGPTVPTTTSGLGPMRASFDRRRTSRSPTTTSTSPTPPAVASASGSAATWTPA